MKNELNNYLEYMEQEKLSSQLRSFKLYKKHMNEYRSRFKNEQNLLIPKFPEKYLIKDIKVFRYPNVIIGKDNYTGYTFHNPYNHENPDNTPLYYVTGDIKEQIKKVISYIEEGMPSFKDVEINLGGIAEQLENSNKYDYKQLTKEHMEKYLDAFINSGK